MLKVPLVMLLFIVRMVLPSLQCNRQKERLCKWPEADIATHSIPDINNHNTLSVTSMVMGYRGLQVSLKEVVSLILPCRGSGKNSQLQYLKHFSH
jgi:hypothetical protein